MTPNSNLAHATSPEALDAVRAGEFAIAPPEILTRDVTMQTTLKMAQVVAGHRTPVLIEGESGTGKELLARFIHTQSDRRHGPFVAVNCAAIPEHLLESELFGYEKGAFTGAVGLREGKFEQASGGTILLDEISEMPPSLQVKLLRVLQEYTVDRLGGRGTVPVDVRVVATTNRSLKQLVTEGRFRDDLFYRINVFPLRLPPLRARIDDLSVLVPHFVCKYDRDVVKEVEADAYRRMMEYPWRGNVRELENVLARAVLLSHDRPRITVDHIVFDGIEERAVTEIKPGNWDDMIPGGTTLREMEKRLILKTLRDTNGNRTHASKVLDISIRTMRNKLREYRMNGELTGLSEAGG